MPGENKSLFLFTAGYPYGTRDEPFLESEIEYLSQAFDQVVIFPKYKPSTEHRAIPENVIINDCLSRVEIKHKRQLILRNIVFVLKIITPSSFSTKRVIDFWKNYKFLLDVISISIIHGKTLSKELKNHDLKNVIFYDYWFANSIYSIGFLKNKRKINKFICRAHGFDIYQENWSTNNVPFFKYRIKIVDELYFISKHGHNHIEKNTPKTYKNKLKTNYLGVKKPSVIATNNSGDEHYIIVSCARVVDFKRIHKIPEVLKKLKVKVKWIHFGDGPFLDELKRNIKTLPENIEVELKGHVSNENVHDFYQKNKVHVLLSLSLSEGLPVSMMEAISFGIPIVAVDAGGIKEIVKPLSGVLLKSNSSYNEIAEKLEYFLQNNSLEKESIVDFFDQNFNAEKNYKTFVANLKAS